MKREGTIGAATFLAIAAVVGVSLQSGSKPESGGRADSSATIKRTKPSITKEATHELRSGCESLQEEFKDFLEIKKLIAPAQCYEGNKRPPEQESDPGLTKKAKQLKFVIATLPDPVHTHLPVLFDQFAVAIQEAAQDEKYDFDSSWLPWDEEDPPFALLADQKRANEEKEQKEDQPGIILFRKALDCQDQSNCKQNSEEPSNKDDEALSKAYREGLVVFVVGEEATEGIHRDQFRNALAWIKALQPAAPPRIERLAILGPTFSGSFPSLAQVLSEPSVSDQWQPRKAPPSPRLAIYSGSVTGDSPAQEFKKAFDSQVAFHSFVQSDSEGLKRFCGFIKKEQPALVSDRVAIVTEDETAYGHVKPVKGDGGAQQDDPKDCYANAITLFYPRDISALRAAYQTKSLFDVGTSTQSADPQKRNLPTDLADPSGKVHDSIRSYGGNQTPLTQEAILLQIVAALHAFKANYIFLRSSNTLDQLFLANFLRRGYPDGRIVIIDSDLMFVRERGTTGLGGSLALSTYPLFPLERPWTDNTLFRSADRMFSSDTTQGTYVALRLLLNDNRLNGSKPDTTRCHVDGDDKHLKIFVPPITCASDPIPDYSPPFWMMSDQCRVMPHKTEGKTNRGMECVYPGPATWLSVISTNNFWPIASLTDGDDNAAISADPATTNAAVQREAEPHPWPGTPLAMKIFLLVLVGFSWFHAWCCRAGSYTAKPPFLAHFASNGKWRHTSLVFFGSCCVAFMAIAAGWGAGVFSVTPGLEYPSRELYWVRFTCVMAGLAILLNTLTTYQLAKDCSSGVAVPRMSFKEYIIRSVAFSALFLVVLYVFDRYFVRFIDNALLTENRVLTYWRAMNLTSGVSPTVPILLFFAGLYLAFWYSLHGLALFGPDRPFLPKKEDLTLKQAPGENFLIMFSQDAADAIERVAKPLSWDIVVLGVSLFVLFLAAPYRFAGNLIPIRSLGAEQYAKVFLIGLDISCTLAIVETWRLFHLWEKLSQLLAFLDRLPLRRTMASLHGFSWSGVWKMAGNVLEVRYKVISRQTECMNHTIASLEELPKPLEFGTQVALDALNKMHAKLSNFAAWYSTHYTTPQAGDLSTFEAFQQSIASASGTVLSKLLVPVWRSEKASLIVDVGKGDKDDGPHRPSLAEPTHIQNAEEFVCLNYLAFVQNILGRLRTMTLTIMLLLIVSTVAMSTYPFDPRQKLSIILVVLFLCVGLAVVKVYADMHRDSTLSHVTNTKPGELGTEFWFKMVGFGLAPMLGLIARVFPGITDFIFSWVQPSLSSLK